MSGWKSNEDRQLECIQKMTETLYEIKNHQIKISSEQAVVMDKAVEILQKLSDKIDMIQKDQVAIGQLIGDSSPSAHH